MTQPNQEVEIIMEPGSAVVVTVPGPQGPPGLQNVVVGPTPPNDPIENMIWIETA